MSEPTEDQYRMAACFNLNPDYPDRWPMEIINRMIKLEKTHGRDAARYARTKLLANWDTVIETLRQGHR